MATSDKWCVLGPATAQMRKRIVGEGAKGSYRKPMMQDKLIEHKHYIDKHGQDLPEIVVGSARGRKLTTAIRGLSDGS